MIRADQRSRAQRRHGWHSDADAPPGSSTFSTQIEGWLRSEDPKTLGGLGAVFAERAFAVTVMLLMFVPALPLPTGGISHAFEIITILIAGQMVIGRTLVWLPRRWQGRQLGPSTRPAGH
jgi:hypothetical protein